MSIFSLSLAGVLSSFIGLQVSPDAPKPPAPAAPSAAAANTSKPLDPIEMQYLRLLAEDDAAQKEADLWIQQAQQSSTETTDATLARATLTARIEQRLKPVREGYELFLRQHPKHARARLAYGSFLYETHDEEDAVAQWEKAVEADPRNPAGWNNLANHYGHRGPVKKAFEYYAKAIELNPEEPVYYQNLATTTYLFRQDAIEHYKISEKEVFDRALDLYRKAIRLDPENFPLATDYAQSYYGIKPLRTQDALKAWNYALSVANDDIERQGVYVHLARVELNSGMFKEARAHLDKVTHEMYSVLKERLLKNLQAKSQTSQEK